MKKSERQVEVLIQSLKEIVDIEKVISTLPRGYISIKEISGHTYYYRQWREGNKIISSYIPESYVSVVRQKIEIRKQIERLLKILKREYRKAEKAVLKTGEVDEAKIASVKDKVTSMSDEDLCKPEVIESLKAELYE